MPISSHWPPQNELKFQLSEIRLLKTGGPIAPMRSNVLKALDETLADPALQKGEPFVLYFSGHGVGRPEGDFLVPAKA